MSYNNGIRASNIHVELHCRFFIYVYNTLRYLRVFVGILIIHFQDKRMKIVFDLNLFQQISCQIFCRELQNTILVLV